MRKAITLLTALTATAASVASFATLAESPDWRYVEGGYSKMDFDDNESFEPDGFVLSSKYLLNSNIYLNGEYSNFEEGSFDFDMLTLGAGYRMPLNATTDAYFGANFERIDGDVDDETGYSVNAGVRSMVTEQVELLGEVGYYDVEDGDATFKVGANYYITPQWAVGTNVSLMRGRKVLLESASAQVFPGHKVALIGSNGCGKSTLFSLLRNEMSVDAGDCVVPADWRIVSVAQETPATDRRAIEYVIDGDKNLRRLQAQLHQAEQDEDGVLIGKIHGQLEQAGAYDVEARAATILSGLGFTNVQLTAPVTDFSGGWRMRLNLAQALLCPSDLLLLDEPTNHLDLDAVIWLEKWLQRYEGTLLLISHDKAFIDNTVAQIISVEQQQLITYTGNYSAFERQRAERLRLQNIEFEKQQQKVAHLTSFITRFKAKASKAKQAQSRIKQLEKMETLLPAHAASPFSFEFVPPAALPNPLVQMEHVQLGYDDHIVLQQVKLNLVPGSRIGLLGRNGQGKSTLIKLLAGVHAPKQGVFDTAKGLKIGYFAQHQLETLDPNATPILHLQRIDEQATEQQLRDYLGGFGFNGDEALSAVAPMSGGEKARLVLALIVYQKPNLLLLDEPTNHLDLEMRHALNIALQGFEGAMVLVSHDRFLLSSVCEDFYLVDSGEVAAFTGDLDDYRDWILKQQAAEKAKANSDAKALNEDAGAVSERKIDRKEEKRREAEFRKQVAPLKKALEKHEKAMDKCSGELKTLEASLSDTSLYNDDKKAELMQLLDKQAKLTQQLEEEEMQWLDAQEQMEAQRASYEAQ